MTNRFIALNDCRYPAAQPEEMPRRRYRPLTGGNNDTDASMFGGAAVMPGKAGIWVFFCKTKGVMVAFAHQTRESDAKGSMSSQIAISSRLGINSVHYSTQRVPDHD